MELRELLLATVVLAASAAPGELRAQRKAPWPADRIGGIGSVAWGASAKDVEAKAGSYVMSRVTEDSGQVMIFRERMGTTAVTALYYLDRGGLVKGVFSAPYGPGDQCELVFEQFKGFVRRLYPSLKPAELRTQADSSQSFCSAASEDRAAWSIDWTDADGNWARVSLEPGEGRVATTFAARAASAEPPQ